MARDVVWLFPQGVDSAWRVGSPAFFPWAAGKFRGPWRVDWARRTRNASLQEVFSKVLSIKLTMRHRLIASDW